MPTYSYRCTKCGKFDVFQKITDAALEKCPDCAGPVKRLIGKNIGVVFRGNRYYCKDYASSTKKSLPEPESDSQVNETGAEMAEPGMAAKEEPNKDAVKPADADKAS